MLAIGQADKVFGSISATQGTRHDMMNFSIALRNFACFCAVDKTVVPKPIFRIQGEKPRRAQTIFSEPSANKHRKGQRPHRAP